MKRHSNLFNKVANWTNLLDAARKARLRKRLRQDVLEFQYELEANLVSLQHEIETASYIPGRYRSFEVRDPKGRLISAAPYRDRVLHHAICNVVGPIFEKRFIADSYACRLSKGQAAAIQRARGYAGKYRFVLKTDTRLFFPSIDHAILIEKIKNKIKDKRLLSLIGKIIDQPFPGQMKPTYFPGDDLFAISERRVGLPIGNQTSQLFGNLYLDSLDHLAKDRMRIPGYVRYMDDIVLFGESNQQLWQWLEVLRQHCFELRLRLHPRKTNLTTTADGFRFLGFHIKRDAIKPFPEAVVRFRRRLRQLQKRFEEDPENLESIRQSICSYWGHFMIAGQHNRFRRILNDFPFLRRCSSWKKLVNQNANKSK